jgi:hypothetical protein
VSAEEELELLLRSVMRGGPPLTVRQLRRELKRRAHVDTDARSIRVALAGSRRFRRVPPRFFQRSSRWMLVGSGHARPGDAGAPVPARPRMPLLAGGAAAALQFRKDGPPTDAIGRLI